MPARSDAVSKELRAIRVALRQVLKSLDRLGPALAAGRATPSAKPRRKLRLTPARRAALKLQGQYMGYMRMLAPAQKTRVKKVRATKGIRAAIAAAKRLGK
jgi:hypothetical protein